MNLKHPMLIIPAIVLWSASSLAQAPENDNDKAIYSLGYELGKDIKREQLQLNPEALIQGAKDAIEGNRALVSFKDRKAALKAIKEKRAEANLEESQAFLAENAKKEGVVSLPSGLQYKVLQSGEGMSPEIDDSVAVHYRGTLVNGAEFASSERKGKPSIFKVSRVIKGWREALLLMKAGAKWELYIPPELAYGKHGNKKIIPPNSALIYDVELVSIGKKAPPAEKAAEKAAERPAEHPAEKAAETPTTK